MRKIIAFILLVLVPALLLGVVLGAVFGAAAYFISTWLGFFDSSIQSRMVFWLFVGMGFVGGGLQAASLLIDEIGRVKKTE